MFVTTSGKDMLVTTMPTHSIAVAQMVKNYVGHIQNVQLQQKLLAAI
jgi:hypothetical protein